MQPGKGKSSVDRAPTIKGRAAMHVVPGSFGGVDRGWLLLGRYRAVEGMMRSLMVLVLPTLVIGGTVHLSYSACVVSMVDPTLNYQSSGKFGPPVLCNAIGKFLGRKCERSSMQVTCMLLRCVEMMAEMQKAHWIGIE